MSRVFIVVFAILYLLADYYILSSIKLLFDDNVTLRRAVTISYLVVSVTALVGFFFYGQIDPKQFKELRLYLITSFVILFFGKLFSMLFLALDDFRRAITWLVNLLPFTESGFSTSRSEFMAKSAIVAGAVPVATMTFGIVSGAHDYRVRRKTIHFKTLPKAFDGIRIAQISDIHTGSFFNKTAVAGGIDLLMNEKPDVAFFTGDLVNNQSEEAIDYLDIFKKINAPLGVYSIMGNHDYGDYRAWTSEEEKQKDIQNLHEMHAYMGYDLLLNENRILKVDGEEIAILGCENWGSGRFAKYGDLAKTVEGTEDKPFKLLLSHDPSHWDLQIRPQQPSIDLTLSGHTHGFQFGVEIGGFRWSPVQYRYKQWADLYREENQYLYVNRGYGYIGYPGRIGILPEVTILELKRSV